MTTPTQEFFQAHAQDGVLTPEQAAQFLELAQGDTVTPVVAETGDVPGVTPDPVSAPQAVQAAEAKPAAEPDPANTVILTRDGKHTISYDKLVEAREGKRQAEAQAQALTNELQALKAQAQARADAGQAPTQADNVAAAAEAAIEQGVDPEIFGDFSEADLAKGIKTLMGREVDQLTAKMRDELAQLVQPLQKKQAVDATDAHMQAIYAKHPDADSVAESQELTDWIARQPSFARAGYESVLQQGTTAEIIEFFDTFKAATGKTQAQGAAQADPKAAARAVLAKLPAAVPASLSDIPGGTAGPANKYEAMANMSPLAKLAAMEEMTPAQQEAYLNRRM